MASGDVEIEIKLPLLNPDKVIEFLSANAKPGTKGVIQKDTYYNHPGRDFLAPKHPFEWLRIREASKGASITYKHFRPEGVEVHDYADEFETSIENPAQMKKIFLALGFKEMAVVEKERDTWLYKDTEIALDKVKELGTFIEVEAMKSFSDQKGARKYLYTVLKDTGAECGPEEVFGYPYLLLAKQGYKKQG